MGSARATAVFDANDSSFQSVARRIDKSLVSTQAKFAGFTGLITKAIAAIGAYKAAAALKTGVTDQFDKGAELDNLSRQTGIAVKDLVVLQKQFQQDGKSAEDIGPAIAHMFKNIATNEEASRAISDMGVNLDDLRKMTPAEQFRALGLAINALPTQIERSNAAMAIFGKEGQSLLSVFGARGFGQVGGELGAKAEILQRDAALFHAISDELYAAGNKTKGFFLGVADRVAPVIKPLLDGFMKLDLTKLGQQVGDFIALFVQAFTDGTLGDLIATSLEISLAKAADMLAGALLGIGYGLGQLLAEGVKNMVTLAEILTTSDFWKGLGDALLAAGQSFVALMLDGVAKILDGLSHIPGLGKAAGWADATRGEAASLRGDAGANAGAAADHLTPAFEAVKNRLFEEFNNVGKSVADGFGKGSGLIDITAMESHLGDLIDKTVSHAQSQTQKALAENPAVKVSAPTGDEVLNFAAKPIVSNLQKIGGSFGGGSFSDPLLAENRAHTSLLREIRDRLPQMPAGPRATPTSAYA